MNSDSSFSDQASWSQPTPPLGNELLSTTTDQTYRVNNDHSHENDREPSDQAYKIFPNRVREHLAPLSGDLLTPVVQLQSSHLVQQDYLADSTNISEDLLETGSGVDNLDESFMKQEESTPLSDHAPTLSFVSPEQLMTPIFAHLPAQSNGDLYDHAPILARRMPKLVATAGSVWRHALPSDTFQDEDGDLRQLRSNLSINLKNDTKPDATSVRDKQSPWLRYDQSSQTLIGFPLNSDVGYHSYTLFVSDRLGNTANETIEISVRPQQSSRAFTHIFTLRGIEVNQNESSMIDTLSEIAKRIAEDLYSERSSKNVVVHSYSLSANSAKNSTSLMSISWSNSSLPITRCNLESVVGPLIDDGYLTPNWSLTSLIESDLSPSQSLIKALGPEFKPSTINISLHGICANYDSGSSSNHLQNPHLATNLRVKARIGKLRWKLGQPIMYQIPDDVFATDKGANDTQNLTLLLHTIDGLTLDQDINYNFLEFNQESKTIFGLPFEITKHTGQKELMLTAKHNLYNQVARETFIFDIEPQDLTTINNRAFRMSLYFITRTSLFGPREQVHLSRRMINALDTQELNFNHDQAVQEFTVIHIQKFRTGASIDSSASLSDPANAWKYLDKIHLVDDSNLSSESDNQLANIRSEIEGSYFYKLTWTNETIGYRGDCPVEVIKDNILYALERSMLDYVPPNNRPEDPSKNDSVRFYERLRSYFEPEFDLIHLRFEPMSACVDALELHDVGNSEVADMADRASEYVPVHEPETPSNHMRTLEEPKVKDVSPINSDEYWAIVVLIILVVAIIFVVMMLFMGLHTYRINQEKRFELQMKLVQARQNSMYLSSLVLADQARPFDIVGRQSLGPASAKTMFVEERSSRKPVILDNEKEFLTNGLIEMPVQKPTAVQLMGHSIHTTPLKPNMTFTMDNLQGISNNIGPDTMMANQLLIGNQQLSMTLNRRPMNNQATIIGKRNSPKNLSQSQSIVTIASVGSQTPKISHPQASFYAPLPTFYESQDESPRG